MNTYKTILSACMLSILSACSMFEVDKDNLYSTDRLYSDPAFAEGLLLQAYNGLPLTKYSFDETATDDAVTNDKQSDYLKMSTGQWTSIFNPMDSWGTAYSQIAYLNKFINIIDKVEWSWESENRNKLFAQKYAAEAHALRAFYHFQVLQNHGGVSSEGQITGIPFLNEAPEAQDAGTWNKKRDSYRESVNKILSELDLGNELPWKYEDNGDSDHDRIFGSKYKNRVDGSIVMALKARVALHGASPAFNNGEYDQELLNKALSAAAMLIEKIGGIAELTDGGLLSDPVFYNEDDDRNKTESIWRGNYFKSRSMEGDNFPPSLYGNGRVNPTQNFVDVFPDMYGTPIQDNNSIYDETTPYENRDPRLTASVYYNGSKMKGSVLNTIDDPKNGINKQTNSTRTGYYLKKCLREDASVDPTAGIDQIHIRPLIRYTEMFLIYAEAANELWGPMSSSTSIGSAKDVIKAIRQRAGIVDDRYIDKCITKEQMRELIRNERRIELSFEGFRFWDMRRWGLQMDEPAKGIYATKTSDGYKYESVVVEERKYSPYMQFGPIPNNEILKASELIQNKGW